MQFKVLTAIAMAAAVVSGALVPQKSVIVTYQDDTPENIVTQAMDAIVAAGGMITHEYKLIKGFAAKAPAKVLETVSAWGVAYNAVVEEDQIVNANVGGF